MILPQYSLLVNRARRGYDRANMKISTTTKLILLAFVIFGGLIAAALLKNTLPSQYDDLAMCISDSGGKMYAAYWCTACGQQEELLGSAMKHIDRVECSSPGSSSFDLCPDIESTPTWERGDGSRFTGVRPPESLAEEFGCSL